jgi:N-acetylmuramoyl-L-alanine amidase
MKNKKLLHATGKCLFFVTIVACFIISTTIKAYSAEQRIKKENFVIAIDAGHSEQSPGATGARGTKEYVFNAKIAELLCARLIESGFKKSFIFHHDARKVSLKKRIDKIKTSKYDVFISIHHDSVQPMRMSSWIYKGKKFNYCDKYKGYSIFMSEKSTDKEQNLKLSGCIADALLKAGFKPSLHHAELIKGESRKLIDSGRGIYEFSSLAILRSADSPAVLIECGIMVNRDEEILLQNPCYQDKFASGMVSGIINYYRDMI